MTLINMGLDTLVIHLFIFYFATMAAITPPVALSSYTAAGIANCSQGKTGVEGLKLALTGFIIPFVFVYNPSLLIGYGNWPESILAVASAILGVLFLSCGLQGYILGPANFTQRVLGVGSAFLLIKVGWLTDILGFAAMILAVLYNKYSNKR
jgi:TRAP-type uncharacterized transport system fused permease subunit